MFRGTIFTKGQLTAPERVHEIEATLKSIKNLGKKGGYEFNRTTRRIKNLGRSDIEMYKAIIYKQNIYKALESAKNFDNYNVLMKKLDTITNPIKFYEYISENVILTDIFKWYDNEQNTFVYGGFTTNEEAFNYALEQLSLL